MLGLHGWRKILGHASQFWATRVIGPEPSETTCARNEILVPGIDSEADSKESIGAR